MRPLEPPDSLHLQAAQGWLGLGNYVEADGELDQITAKLRIHPGVLKVRLDIYIAVNKWEAALDIATALTKMLPEHPLSWLQRSFCLHQLKRTVEARDNLLPVVKRFPQHALMRYKLACYECLLGRLKQARNWLGEAFELGDQQTIKFMALNDPDLEPLWKDIGST